MPVQSPQDFGVSDHFKHLRVRYKALYQTLPKPSDVPATEWFIYQGFVKKGLNYNKLMSAHSLSRKQLNSILLFVDSELFSILSNYRLSIDNDNYSVVLFEVLIKEVPRAALLKGLVGIRRISELCKCYHSDLLQVKGLGEATVKAIEDFLARHGFHLDGDKMRRYVR